MKPLDLSEPVSFVDMYVHHCGESEVPYEYNLWACLSLISAAVADRVWFPKFGKLHPNLYVALLGPSANGKNEAIRTSMNLAKDHPKIGVYKGKASIQYLLDYMSHTRQGEAGARLENKRLYLVTPEVSMALRRGDSADDFIKNMTELYTPDGDLTFIEGTRGSGTHKLKGYCINWIFGSNLKWLTDSMPDGSVSGGFFGRVLAIHQDYDRAKRIETPRLPPDYAEVCGYLHARLNELCEVEGQFEMTPTAWAEIRTWYYDMEKRPWPADDDLVPAWKRQHDLILKLAQLLSLADGLTLTITRSHLVQAIELSKKALRSLAKVQESVTVSPATRGTSFLGRYLRGSRRLIMHSELLKKYNAQGYGDAEDFRRDITTLRESRQVRAEPKGRGVGYEWLERRLPADSPNGGPPEAESD